jgi:hypothetical protein
MSTPTKYIYHNLRLPKSFNIVDFSYESAHLLSHIIYKQGYNKVSRIPETKWIAVSYNFLSSIFGNKTSPSKYLKELVDAGIVQFKKIGNSTYWVDQGICQQVCLTLPYYQEVINSEMHSVPVKTPRLYTDGKPKKNVRIKAEKPSLLKIIETNYENITILDSWQTEMWGIDAKIEDNGSYIHDKSYAKRVFDNTFEVSQPANGRIYHPVIEMSRGLRKYVRYNGKTPCKIDIKACHPFLLAHFADEQDKEQWLELCRKDIYSLFVNDDYTRDMVKISFQKALTERSSDLCACHIQKMIRTNFPSIWSHLQSKWQIIREQGKADNSVQLEMQQLESKIFVDYVLKKLAKKVWCLPMHDGIMLEEKDYKKAVKLIDEATMKILGFKFIITKE